MSLCNFRRSGNSAAYEKIRPAGLAYLPAYSSQFDAGYARLRTKLRAFALLIRINYQKVYLLIVNSLFQIISLSALIFKYYFHILYDLGLK